MIKFTLLCSFRGSTAWETSENTILLRDSGLNLNRTVPGFAVVVCSDMCFIRTVLQDHTPYRDYFIAFVTINFAGQNVLVTQVYRTSGDTEYAFTLMSETSLIVPEDIRIYDINLHLKCGEVNMLLAGEQSHTPWAVLGPFGGADIGAFEKLPAYLGSTKTKDDELLLLESTLSSDIIVNRSYTLPFMPATRVVFGPDSICSLEIQWLDDLNSRLGSGSYNQYIPSTKRGTTSTSSTTSSSSTSEASLQDCMIENNKKNDVLAILCGGDPRFVEGSQTVPAELVKSEIMSFNMDNMMAAIMEQPNSPACKVICTRKNKRFFIFKHVVMVEDDTGIRAFWFPVNLLNCVCYANQSEQLSYVVSETRMGRLHLVLHDVTGVVSLSFNARSIRKSSSEIGVIQDFNRVFKLSRTVHYKHEERDEEELHASRVRKRDD